MRMDRAISEAGYGGYPGKKAGILYLSRSGIDTPTRRSSYETFLLPLPLPARFQHGRI